MSCCPGSFSVSVSYVINDTCHAVLVPISVSASYVINDTFHAVLVPSVLVYPMSSMTPVMLSWCVQC